MEESGRCLSQESRLATEDGCYSKRDEHAMPVKIRVMHVGLGPIGAAVLKQVASRSGLQIVSAVDVDPQKVGRDVGEVAGVGRQLRATVVADLGKAIRASKPDIAVLCTSS